MHNDPTHESPNPNRDWGNFEEHSLDIGTFYPTELLPACRFTSLIPFPVLHIPVLFVPYLLADWSQLPLPVSLKGGTNSKLTMCTGYSKPFTSRAPPIHCCHFRKSGFPFQCHLVQAVPAVVYPLVPAAFLFISTLLVPRSSSYFIMSQYLMKSAKSEQRYNNESSIALFLISVS